MMSDPTARGGNFLTDAEAVTFTGAANITAITTAFTTYANQNVQPVFFHIGTASVRHWFVHDLCTIYHIDHYAAQGMLNRLQVTGGVSGAPIAGSVSDAPVISYAS